MTRIGLFTNYRDRIGHALIEKKPDIDDLIMIYTLKMGLKWQKGESNSNWQWLNAMPLSPCTFDKKGK